jgi:hypothetical protein
MPCWLPAKLASGSNSLRLDPAEDEYKFVKVRLDDLFQFAF